jgi:hypothetical protein
METNARIRVDDNGLARVLASRQMRDALLDVADPIVEAAAFLAPKRSGRGAESIHSQPLLEPDGWHVRIGWTTDRYYLRFQDQGSRGKHPDPARHFMLTALERART